MAAATSGAALTDAAANAGSWSSVRPGLSSATRVLLEEHLGFTQMTPVQAAVLPLFLANKDVAVEAVTGSGKTLSFVVPILEILLAARRSDRGSSSSNAIMHASNSSSSSSSSSEWAPRDVGAIIITPTRELAVQIYDVLNLFCAAGAGAEDGEQASGLVAPGAGAAASKSTMDLVDDDSDSESDSDSEDQVQVEQRLQLRPRLLIGGGQVSDDLQQLRTSGGNIIVATPGRLEDILKRNKMTNDINLRTLEVLVLDEADRLLDMGFRACLTNILSYLPKQRRTGLFSATQTDEVEELVRAGLRNPVRVTVKVQSVASQEQRRTPSTLRNMYMLCDSEHKLWRLVMLLQRLGQECKTIVYFATCAGVEYYSRIFPHLPQFRKQANMLNWFALHGHMTASKRSVEYARFKNAPVGVLFCTDVAARGLDMPDVDWVLQYDPPQDPDAFVHRCGRTARLGKRGSALIFIRPKEDTYVSFLAVRKSPVEEFDGRLDVNGSIEETDGNQNILRFESFALKDRATQGSLDLMAAIRALAVKDRDVFEKGQVAFVSFVRSYKEHKCSLVFRLKELHLGRVAVSFGLVVLPRMPELRGVNADGFFVPLADIHPNDIPFADKVREKARQARLATRAAERAAHPEKFAKGPKKESEAWSKQKARKDRKEKRQETKRLVRERELLKNGSEYALLAAHQQGLEADAASAAAEGQQPDDDDDEEEEDELEKEARLMRKVKSGKLSSAQFDKRMGYKRTSAFADMVDEGDEDAPVNDDSDDEDDEEDDQDDEQKESAPQRGSKRPNSHDTNQLAAARKKPRSGF